MGGGGGDDPDMIIHTLCLFMILVDPPLPPLQHPMVQQSMQQMMNNPELMEQMIRNNPLFAGNPEMVGVISTLSNLIAMFIDLFSSAFV